MKHNLITIWGVAVLLTLTPPVWGHGTIGTADVAEGIRIAAAFDDGEPMSYAEVEITAPGSAVPFQKGRTDRNGVFMFAPDTPGPWQIVIHDGMGHQLVLDHEVAESEQTASPTPQPRTSGSGTLARQQGLVTGLAIIFGICGCAYGWKARQRPIH